MDCDEDLGHVLHDFNTSMSRHHPLSHRLAVLHFLFATTAIVTHIICLIYAGEDSFIWIIGHGLWGGGLIFITGCLWIRYGTSSQIQANKLPLLAVFLCISLEVALVFIALSSLAVGSMVQMFPLQGKDTHAVVDLVGCAALILVGLGEFVVCVISLVRCSRGPHGIDDITPSGNKDKYGIPYEKQINEDLDRATFSKPSGYFVDSLEHQRQALNE